MTEGVSKLRVLVVEDDADQRRILALLVKSGGHTVDAHATLAEARAAGPFDLALVDRRLPDGDGLEWVQELTAQGRRAFLITGDELRDAGVPVLWKPIRAADLDELLGTSRR